MILRSKSTPNDFAMEWGLSQHGDGNANRREWIQNMSDSRLVYSTESGRICPACAKPDSECNCKNKRSIPSAGDGIIRIRREIKGRKGKTATIVCGFQLDDKAMKMIAAQLKRACGTGGSVKDGEIIIQGDHRRILKTELTNRGYKVKLAGG
jgi:translation initiation factor 1